MAKSLAYFCIALSLFSITDGATTGGLVSNEIMQLVYMSLGFYILGFVHRQKAKDDPGEKQTVFCKDCENYIAESRMSGNTGATFGKCVMKSEDKDKDECKFLESGKREEGSKYAFASICRTYGPCSKDGKLFVKKDES